MAKRRPDRLTILVNLIIHKALLFRELIHALSGVQQVGILLLILLLPADIVGVLIMIFCHHCELTGGPKRFQPHTRAALQRRSVQEQRVEAETTSETAMATTDRRAAACRGPGRRWGPCWRQQDEHGCPPVLLQVTAEMRMP